MPSRCFVALLSMFWFVASVSVASAQTASAPADETGFKFHSLTVSSGEDPISSGITGIVRFTDEDDRLVELAVQHEQAWLIYGQKLGQGRVRGLIGGTVGHFQGAPYVGPIMTTEVRVGSVGNQPLKVSAMYWPALFAGEPRNWKTENDGVENPEGSFAGHLVNASLAVGRLSFVYTKLNFLDDPWNTLPGMSYTAPVRKDVSVTGSVTRNTNAERWLFYMGITWKPGDPP